MFVMTTKVNLKKILVILAAVVGVILALLLIFSGGSDDSMQTGAPVVSGNDARVKFLTDFGWEVSTSPMESGQVLIPQEQNQVFERYNALQKSQGYDLTQYAGKNVMRYVYKVNNYPDATEPVYATLLVYKNEIIGGDITDTAPTGAIQGFKKTQTELPQTQPTETTVPATT